MNNQWTELDNRLTNTDKWNRLKEVMTEHDFEQYINYYIVSLDTKDKGVRNNMKAIENKYYDEWRYFNQKG